MAGCKKRGYNIVARNEQRSKALYKKIVLTLSLFLLGIPNLFAQDPKEIFRKAIPTVCVVTNTQPNGRAVGLGSGFIVDPQGVIVTNRHVLKGARQVSINFKDGATYTVNGVYFDADRDICLLKVDARNLPVLPLADSESMAIGEKVYTIGNPLGLAFTFSDGLLSGKRSIKEKRYLQFTAPISPGNSGGPLLDSLGQAVGIVTATTSGENLNFALAIDEIKPLIATISTLKFESLSSGITQDPLEKQAVMTAPMRDDDHAIFDYTNRIELNINPVAAYNNRGLIYIRNGNYDQAIADFNKALELNPKLVDAYCNRGAAHVYKGNYEQAVQDSTKALKLDRRLVEAYSNRGIAHLHLLDYDQAIKDFSRVVKFDSQRADAYHNRAIAYHRKGKYSRAWADLHKVEKLGSAVDVPFWEELKKDSGREY